jgi:hypothetical protein
VQLQTSPKGSTGTFAASEVAAMQLQAQTGFDLEASAASSQPQLQPDLVIEEIAASDATPMQLQIMPPDLLAEQGAASSGAADGGVPSPDYFRAKFQQQPSVAILQEAYLVGVAEGTLKSWVLRYAKQWKWAEVAPQVRQALAMQAY